MKDRTWTFKLDGQDHTVSASLPWSFKHSLSVHFDGTLIHKSYVWSAFGKLYEFKKHDHDFAISVEGLGHLGKMKLHIDGHDADYSTESLSNRIQHEHPAQPLEKVQNYTVSIVETQRHEEALGEEKREIDNLRSDVQVHRKIIVSREWSQSCTIEHEEEGSVGGEAALKLAAFVDIKANAEKALRKKYSISTESKRIYSEEVSLTILPRTKVQVIFAWKQLWQCGMLVLRYHDGAEFQLPFRVCLEPTFDQRQIDLAT